MTAIPWELLPDSADVGRRRRARHRRVLGRRPRRPPRHAAVRLRRGPPAGPVPGGGRGLRRRRRLRDQGVPVPGHGPPRRTRRGCTSTSPPAASCTSPWPPACPPSAWCCTATTSPTPSWRGAREVGVGRIVVDSFDELDRLEALHGADGRVPRVLLRVTPGHRGPHPRVHPHRAGRLEVRLHPVDRRRRLGGRAGAGVAGRRAGGHPLPHRQPGVRGRLLPRRGRRGGPVVQRARPARAVDRRRAGRGLRRGRGGTDDHRVGRRRPRRVRRARASPPGSPPSRAGPSWPRPRSPCTRSARSRTCPASAPTCRSTGA